MEQEKKRKNGDLDEFIQILSKEYELEIEELYALWERKRLKSDYLKLKTGQLKDLCKDRGLKSSGTKKEIVQRLEEKIKDVLLFPNNETFIIEENQYGNYEHFPTTLVFDKKNRKVIGKQQGEQIIPLTEKDILYCQEYRLDYTSPSELE